MLRWAFSNNTQLRKPWTCVKSTLYIVSLRLKIVFQSLRSLASPSACVIRSAHNATIAAPKLVPGDIVDLRTGDVIPADVRLLESVNLETDEALLTGESLPVAKDASAVYPRGENIGVGDRLNMAFASSTVTKGRARGIVAATGMRTEIGTIAASLQGGGETRLRRLRSGSEAPRRRARFERFVSAAAHTSASKVGHFLGVNVGTPLQRRLSQLAVGLFLLAVVFAVVVEAANNFSSRKEVIIYAVSTGLSMIPASLVVVLTITLAIGTKRMVERNVIVRKLDSLEALGAVTDVCSDKTGSYCF
jgi:Na+-exporting ATPase